MPRKILFVLPNAELGGAEAATLRLLDRLDPRRFAPTMLFINGGAVVDETRRRGIPTHLLSVPLRLRHPKLLARGMRETWDLMRGVRPDLIYSSCSYAHLIAGPVATLARVPSIVYQHGPVGGTLDRLASLIPAAYVVTNSQHSARLLRALSTRRLPLEVIPPGTEPFPDEKAWADEINRRYAIAPDALTLGIIARFYRWKGIHVALAAAAPLLRERPSARFFVVGAPYGNFAPGYEAELHALVAYLKIADQVIFTGFHADVRPFLARLDIAIHASLDAEPFGLSIVEAMMAGKAVVASGAGGPLEIFNDGGEGLFHRPGDPRDLERQLRRLADDPALRHALGVRARARAQTLFSAESTTREMERLFDRAVA